MTTPSTEKDDFVADITDLLHYTTGIAIDMQTDFFGVDCKLYYPRGSGHYSGFHDDLDYPTEPDTIERLVIPGIYRTRRFPEAGVNDHLQDTEYTIYARTDLYLPYRTLIVVNSDRLGTYQFVTDVTDTITSNHDAMYKRITCYPYMNFRTNDTSINFNQEELKEQYVEMQEEHKLNYTTSDGRTIEIPEDDDMSIAKDSPNRYLPDDSGDSSDDSGSDEPCPCCDKTIKYHKIT